MRQGPWLMDVRRREPAPRRAPRSDTLAPPWWSAMCYATGTPEQASGRRVDGGGRKIRCARAAIGGWMVRREPASRLCSATVCCRVVCCGATEAGERRRADGGCWKRIRCALATGGGRSGHDPAPRHALLRHGEYDVVWSIGGRPKLAHGEEQLAEEGRFVAPDPMVMASGGISRREQAPRLGPATVWCLVCRRMDEAGSSRGSHGGQSMAARSQSASGSLQEPRVK